MEFNKVIEKAEKYLENKALPIIKAVRSTSCKNVDEMLEPYKPNCTIEELKKIEENELKEILLDRFCEQLQNYQAMPRAINYKVRQKDILEALKKASNKNELLKKFVDSFNFKNGDKNPAWIKYTRGIWQAKGYVNNLTKDKFIGDLEKINNAKEDFQTSKNSMNKIKEIHGIGDALKYDFFKELCCDNLCKPDVHIVDICKEIKGFNFSTENPKKDEIAKKFIELCDKKNVYYCDKILWLCCTGNFYKDEIIITKISKEAFFNFLMNN